MALALCLGVLLSVTLFYIVRDREHAIMQADFERQANTYAAAIQSGIERSLEVIESIGGFYAASVVVERHAFQEFVKGPLTRHGDIQALSWNPRVKDQDRASFEAASQSDGLPNFQITERNAQGNWRRAERRAEYISVIYIEPLEGNEAALGFDMASNPTRLIALETARDTGEMIATGRITLVQKTGKQNGFIVFRPVYRNGSPHDTLEDRRESLLGYVVGVFRVGDMVQDALRDMALGGIAIDIYDEMAAEGDRALYG